MILSDTSILAAIKAGDITVTPFDVARLGPNSYDVTLARTLLTLRGTLDAARECEAQPVFLTEVGMVLQPGQLYLGTVNEHVAASAKYVPMIDGTSSAGRLGISVHVTAGRGDANMVEGDVTAGRYYLSPTTPGKLQKARPGVAVPVAYIMPGTSCEDGAIVLVRPQFSDFPNAHIHYKFNLVARPAGTTVPPAYGQPHEITDADSSLEGWLPADHESFGGLAPAGACFGYNLAAHTALGQIWPPAPINAAVIELLRERDDASLPLAGRVPDEYVRIDANGIWWMTACYDHVPWPTALDTTASASLSLSDTSSESLSPAVCPDTVFSLVLWFLRLSYTTADAVVTSLAPDTDQPIEVVDCDGQPARTGDLKLRINTDASIDAEEEYGGLVLKGLVGDKFVFKRGYAAEGLVAQSDRIILSGSRQRRLTPGDNSTPLVHQGIVEIDALADPTARELSPEIVRLGDALDREYQGVTHIGLVENRNCGARMRFNIPYAGLPTNPRLTIRATLFGYAAGPWCELTLTYSRIARPEINTPSPIATGDTALTFDVVGPSEDSDGASTPLPAFYAIEVDSEEFEIAAGDTVFVDIQRAADAEPTFASEIGLLRIIGLITAGG
jgi:hypothetical protein